MSNQLMTIEAARADLARIEWIEKRDEVLDDALLIETVDTPEQNETAGQTYSALRGLEKEIESARKRITVPIDNLKSEIMQQARDLTADVTTHYVRLKGLCDAFATKQLQERRRMEAEAEALRRKQIEDEIAARAEAEAAADAAAANGEEPGEVYVEPVVVSPPVRMPTATTTATTSSVAWKFEVVNKRLLPDDFLTVNEPALNAMLRMQKQMGKTIEEVSIPGVRVFEVAITRSR